MGSVAVYGADNRGIKDRLPAGRSRFLRYPNRPDWLRGPPSLFNGYREPFPGGKATQTSGYTSTLPQALMACLGATLPLSHITQF